MREISYESRYSIVNIESKEFQAIQEVNQLVAQSKAAQKIFQDWEAEDIDNLVSKLAEAAEANAERLAKMAVEETHFGNVYDKTLKNKFASSFLWNQIKVKKTIGILKEDESRGIIDVAVPLGIILGLIPSTNPTSTVIYKVIISLKAGNSIILSPHPSAINCTMEAVNILAETAKKMGAPEGLISAPKRVTKEVTKALMEHPDIALILATGGSAMVKAAYSSGNPAIGVGPGNTPAYIEKTADIEKAVTDIVTSKTFDNGVICASEQSVVFGECLHDKLVASFKAHGGYFLTPEESERVGKFLLREDGSINPQSVGKSVEDIAKMVGGLNMPPGTRLLLSEQTEVSHDNPYSREKLCPILGFYSAASGEAAYKLCRKLLENEGSGHTFAIHTKNEALVKKLATFIPASRIVVNSPSSLGGIGGTTNICAALTLGCGAIGGSSTSDNVSPKNLFNVRKVAYGVRQAGDLN